jgi:hypothetical protein
MGGLRRFPRLRDEILGADETINDAALAGEMGGNYADEEAKDRRQCKQEEDLGWFRTPSNTEEPDEYKHTRSWPQLWWGSLMLNDLVM